AEVLLDRAIAIFERTRSNPRVLFQCYQTRGEISWAAGRKSEAETDLHLAMDLAEAIRSKSGGAGRERARSFSNFAEVFEIMVAWQVERQDVSKALSAIERGRARSLQDEMNLRGANIDAGRTVAEKEAAVAREDELNKKISFLESRLSVFPAPTNGQKSEVYEALVYELSLARKLLYEHDRDRRNNSPVYRNLLAVGGGTLRISQLQRRLEESRGHMLVYMIGEKGSYLVSIRSQSAELFALNLDAKLAKTLGTTKGPLTDDKMRQILMHEDKGGVLQQISDPKQPVPVDRLHALWQVLLPDSVQTQLTGAETERILIVPDGALTLLPFETLVVKTEPKPKYLLEVAAPVLYAPSATVLYNLYQRPADTTAVADRHVVTIGNPTYTNSTNNNTAHSDQIAASGTSRYGGHGPLAPLPNTGIEAQWVADIFGKVGMQVSRLLAAEATEANLRSGLGNCQMAHLACHGLVDQTYGNFFGALALTPGSGSTSKSSNDGFLTLAEVYQLDLSKCELTILSACQTNYGPQQQGEGTWAMSRGFLVAGSRRIVASNWLVDDEAAASLISYFCGGLAKPYKAGTGGATGAAETAKPALSQDYALALQASKRWIAGQDKWRHPYYWGALVLVGPE
ncbi:MAG: CHAT domain-containing protein, partial [Planctomycetota bacterium]|nr:CHAT domain-containing protein [Planctomycetota bacterium]